MTLPPQLPNATVPDSLPRAWSLESPRGQPSSAVHRAILIGAGCLLIAGLTVARWLTPDESGMGTHRQLGLPACGFAEWLGVPCPSCGMTTSIAHLTRGHLIRAAQCNLGGLLAGITALYVGPWMLISGIRGRWIIHQPSVAFVLILAVATYFVLVAQWVTRLWSS